MKKTNQNLFIKAISFFRKPTIKRSPRNYNTLVENFKTKIQLD